MLWMADQMPSGEERMLWQSPGQMLGRPFGQTAAWLELGGEGRLLRGGMAAPRNRHKFQEVEHDRLCSHRHRPGQAPGGMAAPRNRHISRVVEHGHRHRLHRPGRAQGGQAREQGRALEEHRKNRRHQGVGRDCRRR
jgi:hypothetical protein